MISLSNRPKNLLDPLPERPHPPANPVRVRRWPGFLSLPPFLSASVAADLSRKADGTTGRPGYTEWADQPHPSE